MPVVCECKCADPRGHTISCQSKIVQTRQQTGETRKPCYNNNNGPVGRFLLCSTNYLVRVLASLQGEHLTCPVVGVTVIPTTCANRDTEQKWYKIIPRSYTYGLLFFITAWKRVNDAAGSYGTFNPLPLIITKVRSDASHGFVDRIEFDNFQSTERNAIN